MARTNLRVVWDQLPVRFTRSTASGDNIISFKHRSSRELFIYVISTMLLWLNIFLESRRIVSCDPVYEMLPSFLAFYNSGCQSQIGRQRDWESHSEQHINTDTWAGWSWQTGITSLSGLYPGGALGIMSPLPWICLPLSHGQGYVNQTSLLYFFSYLPGPSKLVWVFFFQKIEKIWRRKFLGVLEP